MQYAMNSMKYFLFLLFAVVIILSLIISIIPSSFAQSNSTTNDYYNPFLGIKLQYPNSWEKVSPSSFESNTCNLFGCIIAFNLKENNENADSYFSIRSYDLAKIKDECKCSNSIDFMVWKYDNLKNIPGFLFLDDKNITIAGNHSVWVMEYLSLSINGFNYNYDVLLKNYDKFYDIRFESPSKEYYTEHIVDIKNILNSIEFVPVIQGSEKPSFLTQEYN